MYNNAYDGKTILITGHTGFKGAWLTIYLRRLGANVVGYALEPPTPRNLFTRAGLEPHMTHYTGDVRNMAQLAQTVIEHQPDFIFHMAAQPLVLASYENPVETFEVNMMGSVAVLEAVRQANVKTTVVMVATDKVYENREWPYGYRENDALGGYDPYSASKGAMEIAVSSYTRSFFKSPGSSARVASARSGNVIGGGDWAENRLVPDCIRALADGETIPVRNPRATRPWQHVLEPLAGYLWLGAQLAADPTLAGPWNFGPSAASNGSVASLVKLMIESWGDGTWEDHSNPDAPHEAGLLRLSIDKAQAKLGWGPVWGFEETIRRTVAWYRDDLGTEDAKRVVALCERDIDAYEADAGSLGLTFAK